MYTAILLLPLLGAVIAGFFNRVTGEKMAMVIPTAILMFCAVLSWIAFFSLDEPGSIELFRWIGSGEMQAYWSIRVDRRSTLRYCVKRSKPACPWYCPIPLAPRPPNGSSLGTIWFSTSLRPTPPDTVRAVLADALMAR